MSAMKDKTKLGNTGNVTFYLIHQRNHPNFSKTPSGLVEGV
jgi:hypothetical protein